MTGPRVDGPNPRREIVRDHAVMCARPKHHRRRLQWAPIIITAIHRRASRLRVLACQAGHKIQRRQPLRCAHRTAHHRIDQAMFHTRRMAASPWETTRTSHHTRDQDMCLRQMNGSMVALTGETRRTMTWHMVHQAQVLQGIHPTAPATSNNLHTLPSLKTRTPSIDTHRKHSSLTSTHQRQTRLRTPPSRRHRSSPSRTLRRHRISDKGCPGRTVRATDRTLRRMPALWRLYLEAWIQRKIAVVRSQSRIACP